METVIRAETPTRRPHEHIVPHAEDPNDREVSKREDACPVRHIAPKLIGLLWPVEISVRDAVVEGAENNVEHNKRKYGK